MWPYTALIIILWDNAVAGLVEMFNISKIIDTYQELAKQFNYLLSINQYELTYDCHNLELEKRLCSLNSFDEPGFQTFNNVSTVSIFQRNMWTLN